MRLSCTVPFFLLTFRYNDVHYYTMTMVSRRILHKELEQYMFELFIKTIAHLKSAEEITNFIEDFLSPTEKIMLSKRLAIAVLLTKGYTYDAIDNILKVSRPTINKVAFWLKHGKSGYRNVVEKILRDQKREELWDTIEELLPRLSPPKALGSIGFEKKQEQGKKLFRRRLKKNLL